MRSEAIWLLLIFLLVFLAAFSLKRHEEGFAPAPAPAPAPVPMTAIPKSSSDAKARATTLNGYWREILQWLSENPTSAIPFIADIKEKFFADDCGIKQPRIDFANLAASYRPVFS